jgi:hypothetical protein
LKEEFDSHRDFQIELHATIEAASSSGNQRIIEKAYEKRPKAKTKDNEYRSLHMFVKRRFSMAITVVSNLLTIEFPTQWSRSSEG